MTASEVRASVKAQAAERHAAYRQYDGYWDGPEWKVVTITKRVVTKMGVAFEKNERTIAKPDDSGDRDFEGSWTAYSVRNGINTLVSGDDVQVVSEEPVCVGAFTFDPATGEVSGPAAYMREQGFDRLRKIESGHDTVFNFGASGASPSAEVAMLVSLQTDYAGWVGARQFESLRA